MNTIGAAIDRGEIEVKIVAWETFHRNNYLHPCINCGFAGVNKLGRVVCALFDEPYDGVEIVPTIITSLASLMSVIVRCSLKKRVAACHP